MSLVSEEISIALPHDTISLQGILTLPSKATKIILFAHGSGSSRHSSRNQLVANYLAKNGLATLLLDLLTSKEEQSDAKSGLYRFDIPLLTKRLLIVTEWILKDKRTKDLKVGYFGASTGAAAALMAAVSLGKKIFALVSRGGRPDLAKALLPKVITPTLLIVGGNDLGVIEWNQEALSKIRGEKKIEIIQGATHLFEETGALEKVAHLSLSWFQNHE
jgi:putative phosphoribosyl transferase